MSSPFFNITGFLLTLIIPIGAVFYYNKRTSTLASASAQDKDSSLQNGPQLCNTMHDDFRGENRNWLLENKDILTNFTEGRVLNLFQPKLNIMSDRNYNGLNTINYNITKYDLIQ